MSYYCSYINEGLKREWEALVKTNPAGGFHQSFEWARFQQEVAWNSYKIGLFEGESDRLVGGAVIFEFSFSDGTSFLYIPEGPILNYANEAQLHLQWTILKVAINSIVKINQKEKTIHLRIEPRLETLPDWFLSGFRKAPINLQPKHTQLIDLKKSKDEILQEMKQKGRYNINLAKKKGVEIDKKEDFGKKELDIFYNLYKQTFERNKFAGKNKDFFMSYLKHCKASSCFYSAKFEAEVLACAISFGFGERLTYLYGASSNKHKELMAPYLLHFEIMKDAKKSGFKEYDLWGIHADEKDREHDWHGITRFKKQFGGKQLDFVGAYDYVFQENLYRDFIEKHES